MSTMTPHSVWTFGDRVRKIRRDQRLSQSAFADLLGVGEKAVAAWESGRNTPEHILEVAQKIETVTGWSAIWIVGLSEDPRPHGGEVTGQNTAVILPIAA